MQWSCYLSDCHLCRSRLFTSVSTSRNPFPDYCSKTLTVNTHSFEKVSCCYVLPGFFFLKLFAQFFCKTISTLLLVNVFDLLIYACLHVVAQNSEKAVVM